MKEGDFVRIDYVGRIVESGEIFDLTKEDYAKQEGVFTPEVKYGSVSIVIGANLVVKGLENALKEMKVGDKKKVKVKPEDAFGERKTEFIKLVPIAEFKKQDMTPYPGMLVNINRLRGRVLSVSGGRVRVDFNHPLAGKELEYDVEIKEQVSDPVEKIKAIMENYLKDIKNAEVSIQNELVEIKIKNEDVPRMIKKTISDMIMKWIENIKKTRFIDEFTQ
jgi:FKBP-type peptidyl-prolyl cis-trans isomerase 2